MFDNAQVLAAFKTLVGFRQNRDSAGWQLTSLTTSDSGLFYNHAHPSITFDNLVSVAPRIDQMFAAGQINAEFTSWLEEHLEQSILTALNIWIGLKIGKRTGGNLLSDNILFDKAGAISNLTPPTTTDFQCIELIPYVSRNIKGTIRRIALHFDSAVSLNVQLFSSESNARLQQITCNHTGSGVEWFDLNWEIEGGKQYYIGYHGSKMLAASSINGTRQYQFAQRGLLHFPTEKHYQATAMTATTDDDGVLWDIAQNKYTVGDNYGINLDLSFECDYTRFLIDNKLLFAEYLRLHVAIDLLNLMIMNPAGKINLNESNIGNLSAWLNTAIVGSIDHKRDNTLVGKWKTALEAIQFDRGSIDETCLPCSQQQPRFNTVGQVSGTFYNTWRG